MEEEKLTPQQKWHLANKEKIKERKRLYYLANKEKLKESKKLYIDENKEKIKEYQKKYREENKNILKEKYQETKKLYRVENKEKIKEYKKNYNENNKGKIKESRKNYVNNKLNTDPIYKFKHNVRHLISSSIKKRGGKKLTKTEIILGCTFNEFRTYIENKFENWMNWDNYGNPKDGIYELNKTWDFDHIIPVTQGMNEIEIIKLNHYTNIQPLCSYHNRFVKKDNNTTN